MCTPVQRSPSDANIYKHFMFSNIYATLISHVARFLAKETAAITYGVAHVSRHESVTWLGI